MNVDRGLAGMTDRYIAGLDREGLREVKRRIETKRADQPAQPALMSGQCAL